MSRKVLLTLAFAVLLCFAVSAVAFAEEPAPGKAAAGSKQALKAGDKATDPTCGMELTVADTTAHAEVNGLHYYFCTAECKTDFEKNPDKYLKKTPKK